MKKVFKIILYIIIFFYPYTWYIDQNTSQIFEGSVYFLSLSTIFQLLILFMSLIIILNNINILKIFIKINKYIILWILLGGFSIIYSIYPSASFRRFLSLISVYGLSLIIFYLFNSKNDKLKVLKIIIFSSFVPYLVGFNHLIYQKSNFSYTSFGLARITSIFYNANVFGFFIVVNIISILILVTKDRSKTLIYYIYLLISILLLVNTFSKSAWIGLFGVLIYFTFFCKINIKRKLLLFIVVFSFVLILGLNELFLERFSYREESSWLWRLAQWEQGVEIWKHHPVFGVGLESFYIPNLYLTSVYGYSAYAFNADMHNDYLRILLETGILGLILWMLFIIRLFIIEFKMKNYRSLFFIFPLFFLITQFGRGLIGDPLPQFYFFLGIGMFIADYKDLGTIR